LHRPLGGHKRAAWSAPIPLESVKAIARASEHHVVDVLLAATTGALDRYIRDHGQTPRFIRTLLPVATPAGSAGDGLGNHYASIFVRLPTSETDPRTRLDVIARDTTTVRRGWLARLMAGMLRLAGTVAPVLERWAVRWGARRVCARRGQAGAGQLDGRRSSGGGDQRSSWRRDPHVRFSRQCGARLFSDVAIRAKPSWTLRDSDGTPDGDTRPTRS
jgi:hypothetical protein